MMFDLAERDSNTVCSQMKGFAETGSVTLSEGALNKARGIFLAKQVDDTTTKQVMANFADSDGYIADPHTAVGFKAAELLDGRSPRITLSTAHPVKFGAAVEEATGITPDLPPHMADLYDREEACQVLENNMAALQALVRTGASL